MSPSKLDHYRKKLGHLVAELRPNLNSIVSQSQQSSGGNSTGELTSVPLHPADRGTDEFLQEMNSVLLENEQFIASESLAALQRVQEGSYGKCERCERPISKERLEALPYTRLCIDCAQATAAGKDVNLNAGREE